MREQVDRLLSRERNKKSAHSRGRERAMGPGQVGPQRKLQNTRTKNTKKYQNIQQYKKWIVNTQQREKKSDEAGTSGVSIQ